MILKMDIKPYLSSASWKAYRRLAVHCLQAACGFGHHHHTDHTFDYAFYRNKVDLARKKSTKIEIADLKNINDRISQWAVAILSTFCVISCSITAILTSNSQFSFVSFFGLQNEEKYFGNVLYLKKKQTLQSSDPILSDCALRMLYRFTVWDCLAPFFHFIL